MSLDSALTKATLGGEDTGVTQPTGENEVKGSLLTEGNSLSIVLAVDGADRRDMKPVHTIA